ncbi:toll/interleukin-1 receptor domain-containing protein [Actinokineospora inagensis]|uniref:toll/interleukin-1 receptor domain-containing protein n=1 Tax=Actinokineospora inagensis TaxID=103730 RepID=UPI000411D066|nr:toll/interleukin-1 receptor domain-containing protein [Actinokineospora inagensis]
MCKVFVNYRVDDSIHATIAITTRLAQHFGGENVFRDGDSLPPGSVYPPRIRRALERADTVLAVLGPEWLNVRDSAGRRRLADPHDWVRAELRMAFERGIPVVPVLLDDAKFPEPEELPSDIGQLHWTSYWPIRRQTFTSDLEGLIGHIDPTTPPRGARAAQTGIASSISQSNVVNGDGRIFANQGHGDQTIQITEAGPTPSRRR